MQMAVLKRQDAQRIVHGIILILITQGVKMAEFSDREIKIIQTMNILRNPLIADAPPETKRNLMIMSLKVSGIRFEEQEIIDLSEAITNEVNLTVKKSIGIMHKFAPMLKDLNGLRL